MLRLVLFACAMIAPAVHAARPMLIHQSQTLLPPAGYYFFGEEIAIDGDWAIIIAATRSPSTGETQTHDALLYHRVNGSWTFDRTLVSRLKTNPGPYVYFRSVAMSNGVAAIGSNPTHIFKRTGNTWAEIAHPFTAPEGDPEHVSGELVWDGSTLLASRPACRSSRWTWGASIATINADGSWSPVQQLSSGDTSCDREPVTWGISGDTVVVGTYTFDWGAATDQLNVFRRSGGTWIPAVAIRGGYGQGDVRGDEIFFSSGPPDGTRVYRNDDTLTVLDKLRAVSTSHEVNWVSTGFGHTNDVFLQDRDLFRKNDSGKYELAAKLVTTGIFTMTDAAKINGQRVISHAWRNRSSANPAVLIYDLPATYTPSPVIATGFGNGVSPFIPRTGTFAVATTASGNLVYRQSSLAGDHRALLGNSDWVEQSIEADIKPTAFSGSDRWAGLAVRYLDDSNYYYVTLRSSGVVALKSMRDGVYTTLTQKTLPIVAGRSYHVALQAFGTLIRVFIDGKMFLYTEEAVPIPHGSAALMGYRAAVDYDNVVAAQLGQQPIFELLRSACTYDLARSPIFTLDGSGTWNCTWSTAIGEDLIRQTSTEHIARALVGTPTDDQVVKCRARATVVNGQDRWFGIAARYVDESNYYYLTMRTSNRVSLRKLVNGAIVELDTATLTVTPGTWYELRLDAVGDELRAFVNGEQVLQATDTSHASGQSGMLTYKAAAEWAGYLAWQP